MKSRIMILFMLFTLYFISCKSGKMPLGYDFGELFIVLEKYEYSISSDTLFTFYYTNISDQDIYLDANTTVIETFYSKGDIIFTDRYNHASIYDGLINSGVKIVRYKHLDYLDLEKKLKIHLIFLQENSPMYLVHID